MKDFSDLLLHPHTAAHIELYIKKPPQAILLTGQAGSGKKTLANVLAKKLLNLSQNKELTEYPYFYPLSKPKNKQEISIEDVRLLIKAQILKTPGKRNIRSLVLIENAENLSIPAQNALLKILEEPKPDTVFILTSTSHINLLPTVVSRTQYFDIRPVALSAAKDFWASKKSELEIENAWRLSQGNVGLLSALLELDEEHTLRVAVKDAKKFLSLNRYERLLMIDNLSKSKEQYLVFLEALRRMTNALHHMALQKNNAGQAKRLLDARKTIFEAQEASNSNVSARLANLRMVHRLSI